VDTMRTPSGEKSSERRGVLAAITQHWVPFLTAVVGLATAVVSLYAAQRAISQRNEIQNDSAALEAQVQALSDTVRKQTATISELRAENDRLRQELEGAAGPGDAGSSSEPVGVFRQTGAVPVVVGSCIDLDSQEPDWGVDSGGHKDLCVSFGANGSARVNARVAVVDRPPTLKDCEKLTVPLSSTTTAETVVGQHLCARSSDKRWAHVRIAAIDRSAGTMSFDTVVWKLDSDP
jgi:hypothetical protein